MFVSNQQAHKHILRLTTLEFRLTVINITCYQLTLRDKFWLALGVMKNTHNRDEVVTIPKLLQAHERNKNMFVSKKFSAASSGMANR